jgi:hypothetical protein
MDSFMHSNQEKQLLRTVLNQLDQPNYPKRRSKFLSMIVGLLLWVLAFCGFEAFFHYGGAPHWREAFLGLACLGIGYILAYQMFKSMHTRQWPIISPYFDRALIEQRLRELGV